MSDTAFRFYHDAMQARREAHFLMRTRLPGRLIYARAKLRQAIMKWQDFAKARKAV